MFTDLYTSLIQQIMPLEPSEKAHALRLSGLTDEHELLQALMAKYAGKSVASKFSALQSGVIPLFEKGLFPWGALPYPQEHAELGTLLMQLQESESAQVALNMAPFQMATLDHFQNSLSSLFQQEGRTIKKALQEANRAFFEAVNMPFKPLWRYSDHDLGVVFRRNEKSTLVCLGSGCKSGMGTFLCELGGVINFGPQLLPFSDASGFGLAGRGHDLSLQEEGKFFKLSYCCAVAAPCPRKSELFNLWDSGYSGLWLKGHLEGSIDRVDIDARLEGFRPINSLVFSFFGKGEKCVIAGTHKLNPRSLDRYSGPVQPVLFWGSGGGVIIDAKEGSTYMQIIPLAGDESFWGADFLATYTVSVPEISFTLSQCTT